ncbi:MAG: Lar family restriction alleviation protein [Cloacibacillus sp.]
MRKYQLTEKTLEQLKLLLEGFTDAPRSIADSINDEIVAEGGEPFADFDIGSQEAYAELLRDFKFLIEDIEGQPATEDRPNKEIHDITKTLPVVAQRTKPKPCPFCGSDDIRIMIEGSLNYGARYVCKAWCWNCHAGFKFVEPSEKQAQQRAFEAWNRRTGDEENS